MNKSEWFSGCETVEDAKKMYRKLSMEHHPDHGGDEETFKAIGNAFEKYLAGFMDSAFAGFERDRGFRPSANVTVFAEILRKVCEFNITVEVIGYWIYCFDSFEIKEVLKGMGFWFSGKHKAWVYSGGPKEKRRTRLSTDDVRKLHGSEVVREREERNAIPA